MSQYTEHDEDTNIDNLLGNPELGFYIDVGSHNPYSASVSRLFYERGWTGINLEPQVNYYQMMLQAHPRDVTLNVACGKMAGRLRLRLADGLSTFVDKFASPDWPYLEVPVMTLEQICDMYVANPIDWLKIDVEGFEREVILGMNWVKYRPKVLCIEGVKPMDNSEDISNAWHDLVIYAGYNFQFWDHDHVNKYFTRKEGW